LSSTVAGQIVAQKLLRVAIRRYGHDGCGGEKMEQNYSLSNIVAGHNRWQRGGSKAEGGRTRDAEAHHQEPNHEFQTKPERKH
jgi:hypothetical protein